MSAVSITLACTFAGGSLVMAAEASAAPADARRSAADDPADGNYDLGGEGTEQVVVEEDDTAEFFPVAGASKEAPRITRSETLKRADTWVGKGIRYSQTGSYKGHRTDCSGYVSMVWRLSTDMTTDTFGPRGVTQKIKKGDLKAGDALLMPKSDRAGHIVLFDKWVNADHTRYVGYELSPSGVQHHELPYPYWPRYANSFYPVRNKSIVDDAQLPLDPGMTEITAGDFTRDSRPDLVAVQVSTGKLFLYPGTGKTGLDTFSDRVEIGAGGWNAMRNLTVGDFTGDGRPDLVATRRKDGKLFLYPGTSGKGLGVLGERVEIGSGAWNGMRHVTAGDFTGDGKTDIVAAKSDTGQLFVYPGTRKSGLDALGDRIEIGTGAWNGMNKVVAGDFNGDGRPDIVATKTETGELFLYPGTAKPGLESLDKRIEIGSDGWNDISDYAAADLNNDGTDDLAAVDSAPHQTGKLYLYRGNGKGFNKRTEIGAGGW
ncbi:FG-GAP repeat domain-containing protein [Streptomyces roseoverticillatus]|uniref:VCBS repeat-containing protein n=1 Tax=Streptomyces roseoverticillatus TaxID=66429 RepID=A0ABV3IVN0_9ACTN